MRIATVVPSDVSGLVCAVRMRVLKTCLSRRLTANIRDGFGLAGVEGVFRSVCELSMSVLRGNRYHNCKQLLAHFVWFDLMYYFRGTLLSVLEAFVHDPLVEWTRAASTVPGMRLFACIYRVNMT